MGGILTWRRRADAWRTWLDGFVPASTPPGSEDASRARMAAGISFLMSLVFHALAVAHVIAGHLGEAALNGGVALATLAAPFALRRVGRYQPVLNTAMGVSLLAMTLVSLERGPGIHPGTIALAEIPLFATLLGGIRVGAVWAALSCATSAVVGAVGYTALARAPVPDRLNDHVVLLIVTGTLFLVAVLYERGRAHQLARIAELETRRHAAELDRLRVSSEARVAQSERLASLGRVAAAVAHGINNPLAYVLENLEFVAEHVEGRGSLAEVRDPIADAIDGARRMRTIVADLGSFTRPPTEEAGKGNVADAVRAAVKMASGQLRPKATVHLLLDALPLVIGDTPRLTQVFLNLLVNAAQAMPEGRAAENRVDVRAAVRDGRVVVDVEDTGEGMPPDVIDRASDAFFSTKPTGQGLGLGLALSHAILEAAGGRLSFESRPGRTVATVWLNVAAPTETATPEPEPAKAVSATGVVQPALAILIVDDEAALARALARRLRGDKVTIATSGREALELLGTGKDFDLVLCDVMMPELSGMDVHEAVVRDHPAWVERFVFMTGGIFTARAEELQRSASNPFLEKPIDPEALEQVLRAKRATKATDPRNAKKDVG